MSPKSSQSSDQIIELTSLIETAKILNSSLDYKFILNHVMLASMGKLGVSKSAAVVDPKLFSAKETGFIKIAKGILLDDSTLSELFSLDLEGSIGAAAVHDSIGMKLINAGVSRIFAVRTSQHLLGYLFVGRKFLRGPQSSEGGELVATEIEFVSTLCNIAAAAIENASVFQQYKDSNFELQRRLQELQTLFELSKEFNLLIDEARAVRTLEFAIMGQAGARKFAICLLERIPSGLREPKSRIVVNRLPGIEEFNFSQESFGQALCSSDQPARLSEFMEKFPSVRRLMDIGAEAVIPFQLQGDARGLLVLGERISRTSYSDSEINFLSSLCNLAAMAIDNARLFEESLAKQRLEEELNLAHTIQENLLPRKMPEFAGCDVRTFHIPTKQVGGDYFDVIKLDENLLCVAIADVSGKGFPAALLMANLQSAFHALITTGTGLVEICARLNNIVYDNTDFDKFITFFAAIYDSREGTLSYVNAGHNYPFLMKCGGEVIRLDKGGLILGVMKDVRYETGEEEIENGDVLYLFTDGVNEALNSKAEQFTEEKLEKVLIMNSTSTAEEILETVKDEIASFVEGAPQSDDITQVCVKFL
jgi:sigma-B regulation protein RsbU (phosphoserine phosphatase)